MASVVHSVLTVIIAYFVFSICFCDALNVRYGGPIIFSFPCKANPRYLTQEYEFTPDRNVTQWSGTFYFDQWLQSANLKADLFFDTSADIEVNPRSLHVIPLDGETKRGYRLIALEPVSINASKIEFKVIGTAGEFPNLLSLTANGLNLCNNTDVTSHRDVLQGLYNKAAGDANERDRNQCGVRYPMITDSEVQVTTWPWQSNIYYQVEEGQNKWVLICGGTLVDINRVLTVGHCVKGKDPSRLQVEIGGVFNATAKSYKIHGDFRESDLRDNIALIFLDKDKVPKKGVKQYAICLHANWKLEPENITIGVVDRQNPLLFKQMVVEDSVVCLEKNRREFSNFLSTKNFCAKFDGLKFNEAAIINGDGFFEQFFDWDHKVYRWKITGLASYTNVGITVSRTDSSVSNSSEPGGMTGSQKTPYYLFTDVTKYLTWIEHSLSF